MKNMIRRVIHLITWGTAGVDAEGGEGWVEKIKVKCLVLPFP